MVTLNNNELRFEGPLTQQTVMASFNQAKRLMPKNTQIELNFEAVSRCDSASLALLMALIRHAKTLNTSCQINAMPAKMQDLATVSGINQFL